MENTQKNTCADKTEKIVDEKTDEKKEEKKLASFKDFLKIEMKVGQILEAEKIEESDKLIKLQVDVGEEKNRQVIAGIAKFYEAENLVGRKVAVVANLKPAKLMGQLSEGMLLCAADSDDNVELLSMPPEMPAGSEIR